MSGALNGAILGLLVTAAVWVGLRLAPRHWLNAATRYFVWWMALAAVAALPWIRMEPRVGMRPIAEPAAAADAAVTPARPARFPVEVPAGRWSEWVVAAAWAASALSVARLMASGWVLRGIQSRAVALADRRPVAVSDEIHGPMAVGIRRPLILIPRGLMQALSEDEMEMVVQHEIAHLERLDNWALVVQRVVEALLRWHPAVWWIGRRIELEREMACDDRVVRAGGESRAYALCLTRVAELTGGKRGPALAATGGRLSARVESLLDRRANRRTRLLKARLAWIAAALGCLTAAVAQIRPPVLLLQSGGLARIPVHVVDPLNRYVAQVGREHFRIFEDGVEQKVEQFSGIGEKTAVGIVVDSAAEGLPQTGQAMAEFLSPTAFDVRHFRSLREGMEGMRAVEPAHRMLLHIGAGPVAPGDLPGSDVPIYTIEISDAAGMAAAAKKIARGVRTQYVLGYRPARAGSEHRVEVRVTQPRGWPPLRVRPEVQTVGAQ